jgi:hypothetical protein
LSIALVSGIDSVMFCPSRSVQRSIRVLSDIGSYSAILEYMGTEMVVSVGLQTRKTAVFGVFAIKQWQPISCLWPKYVVDGLAIDSRDL